MPVENKITISQNEFAELQALAELFKTKLEKFSTPVKKRKWALSEEEKARLRLNHKKSIMKQ